MSVAESSTRRTDAAEASITIDGVQHELPVRKGALGPDVIDIGALYQDGPLHLRPGAQLHGELRIKDLLHRWRKGCPTLSRLSHRSARRAEQLRRDLLSAVLWPASH